VTEEHGCEAQWLGAFRKHRHDVLNELQLVQGYVQLQNYAGSLGAVHRLSTWLASLSELQAQLYEVESQILAVASGSPHVVFRSCARTRPLLEEEVSAVSNLWNSLEERAAECGEEKVDLTIHQSPPISRVTVYCTQGFRDFVQARHEFPPTVFSTIGWELVLVPQLKTKG
jgi:hypothetical protein